GRPGRSRPTRPRAPCARAPARPARRWWRSGSGRGGSPSVANVPKARRLDCLGLDRRALEDLARRAAEPAIEVRPPLELPLLEEAGGHVEDRLRGVEARMIDPPLV